MKIRHTNINYTKIFEREYFPIYGSFRTKSTMYMCYTAQDTQHIHTTYMYMYLHFSPKSISSIYKESASGCYKPFKIKTMPTNKATPTFLTDTTTPTLMFNLDISTTVGWAGPFLAPPINQNRTCDGHVTYGGYVPSASG